MMSNIPKNKVQAQTLGVLKSPNQALALFVRNFMFIILVILKRDARQKFLIIPELLKKIIILSQLCMKVMP